VNTVCVHKWSTASSALDQFRDRGHEGTETEPESAELQHPDGYAPTDRCDTDPRPSCHTCHSVTLKPLICENMSGSRVTPCGGKCLPLSLYVTGVTTAETGGWPPTCNVRAPPPVSAS
jgi:hypothetical protein